MSTLKESITDRTLDNSYTVKNNTCVHVITIVEMLRENIEIPIKPGSESGIFYIKEYKGAHLCVVPDEFSIHVERIPKSDYSKATCSETRTTGRNCTKLCVSFLKDYIADEPDVVQPKEEQEDEEDEEDYKIKKPISDKKIPMDYTPDMIRRRNEQLESPNPFPRKLVPLLAPGQKCEHGYLFEEGKCVRATSHATIYHFKGMYRDRSVYYYQSLCPKKCKYEYQG